MEEADDVLPLASSHGGKLFHVVRSSFVDSLEACLKSYHSRLTQVQINQMLTAFSKCFPGEGYMRVGGSLGSKAKQRFQVSLGCGPVAGFQGISMLKEASDRMGWCRSA